MTLLFLDLATSVGWACGPVEGEPEYGSRRLRARDLAGVLAEFEDWLAALIDERAPERLVFESPILPATTSIDTVRKLTGLACVTELHAHRRGGIRCEEIGNSTVAKWFLGRARYPGRDAAARRKAKKDATVEACRALGWDPRNDDEADALAGWAYARSVLAPQLPERRVLGPLLGAAA